MTHAGPSFARVRGRSVIDVYVTGRDSQNRSQIGVVQVDLASPQKPKVSISPQPVFSFGERSAFDENGVSYPYLLCEEHRTLMYYVGWMPTVLTPFQNHIGLAIEQPDGSFKRVSRAPILERTDIEFSSMGSSCVLKEGDLYRMWYTSFLRWGNDAKDHKHYYVIKYAESQDGVKWTRNNHVCIGITEDWEFSICRPSVIRTPGGYHMWFAHRGEHYRIGYAYSKDGIVWEKQAEPVRFLEESPGFDSRAQAYPHVFELGGELYMIYTGNDYGKEGFGLAQYEPQTRKASS